MDSWDTESIIAAKAWNCANINTMCIFQTLKLYWIQLYDQKLKKINYYSSLIEMILAEDMLRGIHKRKNKKVKITSRKMCQTAT